MSFSPVCVFLHLSLEVSSCPFDVLSFDAVPHIPSISNQTDQLWKTPALILMDPLINTTFSSKHFVQHFIPFNMTFDSI